MALKWAITEQFHEHLYGNNVVIYRDDNPLTYVFTSAKLGATEHHWVASFANYNFALSYQSEKTNVDVDTPFCNPREEHDQHIKADSVHAIISQEAQGTTLMEAYSYHIRVTKTLDVQKDPKAMLVED